MNKTTSLFLLTLLIALITIIYPPSINLYSQTKQSNSSINLSPTQIILTNIKSEWKGKWQKSRYIRPTNQNGNLTGVVVDQVTGLMWKICNEPQTWNGTDCVGNSEVFLGKSTADYSTALNNGSRGENLGYSDWRIPSIKELITLLALDRQNPSINLDIFPSTAKSSYWSKNLYGQDTNSFWTANFSIDRITHGTHYNKNYLRVVRQQTYNSKK